MIATATAITVIVLPASAAQAAPSVIGGGKNVYEIAVDGNFVYWTNTIAVTQIDLSTGVSSVIFRAPRTRFITDLEAGGGSLAILARSTTKAKSAAIAYLYSPASGATRAIASSSVKLVKGAPTCGTELSYGRVDSAGEAMLIRSSYSLSRKLCKKPLSVSSDVIAVGPNGNRTVFAGRIKRGNPLLSLGGPVTDASLVGNTLMLASFGIGTLDLVSQQFVMVAPASRSVQFSLGELDQSGNLLVSALKGRNFRGTYTLYSAESGYSDAKTIEGNARDVSYDVCGDYLMRSKYDARNGDTTSVDVLANPFRSVLAPGPSPLAATTTLSLWNSACDSTNAVYAVSKPSGNDALIYLAPLAG